ncbi:Putative Holliday junction resolvase [Limihaloglobus sulfuriphilus]|uniref:Putative pre-16S rRNA nuclease n=1 Tax=Limihaloglobus sulfuriphilus TaxID=1851148 RepID=A0A1Q2MGZ0_9BACT|nr:Holliday junction resolvase RuvX [Limihaloglobus sulfuriphilus]AQQ71919.1 Putative Holliday junction resolvase [Limihaloglobus sulfuriphilus]
MRYLAIDYGDKRSGLAVCDAGETIVTPLKVLQTDGALLKHIIKVIEDEAAEAVVVGLPLNMDGTEGGQAAKVRDFVSQLSAKTGLKVFLHDERLTSFEAEDILGPAQMSWRKRKKILDAVAAAVILKSFISSSSD